jgi:drug/metabolite transporter (DMT)-like permease
MKVSLVLSTVLINLVTSLLLDHASVSERLNLFVIGIIGSVLAINGLKFLIWGYLHKHYDASKSYPLISLFFPLILLTSILKGEGSLTLAKGGGVLLILLGVLIFEGGDRWVRTKKSSR